MSHDHGGEESHGRRLAVAFGISATVLVAEAAGAAITGSLALLADAAHLLTDTVGLSLALVAARLALRPASPQRTWGYRRAEVLAAGGQSAILLAVGGYALVEGIQRLLTPPDVSPRGLLVFGAIGLVGNLLAMGVLLSGRRANLNMRAAFLEVVSDAVGSLAVIVSGLVIAVTGWTRTDAVAGLLIVALIVPRALLILREAGNVLLETVPAGLDLDEVRRHILELDHVVDVHDLHASQIATGLPVLTAHVVLDDSCFDDGHAPQLLDALQECVAEHFPVSVEHSTFQLEPAGHVDHEIGGHHD
ncbi:MAG: cation diffusion facilitator family transporter [Dermatophilaceae bacterium]